MSAFGGKADIESLATVRGGGEHKSLTLIKINVSVVMSRYSSAVVKRVAPGPVRRGNGQARGHRAMSGNANNAIENKPKPSRDF